MKHSVERRIRRCARVPILVRAPLFKSKSKKHPHCMRAIPYPAPSYLALPSFPVPLAVPSCSLCLSLLAPLPPPCSTHPRPSPSLSPLILLHQPAPLKSKYASGTKTCMHIQPNNHIFITLFNYHGLIFYRHTTPLR